MVPKYPRLMFPLVCLSIMVVAIGLGIVSCYKITKEPEEKFLVAVSMGKVVSVYCDAYHGNTTIQTEFWSIPIRDIMIVPIGKEVFMWTIHRGVTSSKYVTWDECNARYSVYESNMYSLPLTEDIP